MGGFLSDVQGFKKNKLKKRVRANKPKPSAAPENPLLAAIRKAGSSGLKKIDRAQLEEDRKKAEAEAGAGKGGIANGMMGSIAAIMAQRNKAIKRESSDDDSDNDDWSDSD